MDADICTETKQYQLQNKEKDKQAKADKYKYEYLHYVSDTHIFVFDVLTFELVNKFHHNKLNIRASASKCLLTRDKRFFITGSNMHSINATYEVTNSNPPITSRAPMKKGRHDHAFIQLNHKYLLVIGGAFNSTVEAYHLQKDEWRNLAKLNRERCSSVSFVFDDNIVYNYGGLNYTSNKTFEKIEFDRKLKGKWVLIDIALPSANIPLYYCNFIKLNAEEVVIFGGYQKGGTEAKEALLFNRTTNEIQTVGSPLPSWNCFSGTSMSFVNEDRHHIFSLLGSLYMVDVKDSCIDKSIAIGDIVYMAVNT